MHCSYHFCLQPHSQSVQSWRPPKIYCAKRQEDVQISSNSFFSSKCRVSDICRFAYRALLSARRKIVCIAAWFLKIVTRHNYSHNTIALTFKSQQSFQHRRSWVYQSQNNKKQSTGDHFGYSEIITPPSIQNST